MEPEKEKWINDVLGSIDGLKRAEPSPFLYAKIRNRLSAKQSTIYVSSRTVWIMAASFALLLLLNWQVISRSTHSNTVENSDLSTVISDMQLYPNTNQLYGVWSEQNF